MTSIRGALRFSKDVSVILFLGIIFVLGLSVATLLSALEDWLPRIHAVGDEIQSRLRRSA